MVSLAVVAAKDEDLRMCVCVCVLGGWRGRDKCVGWMDVRERRSVFLCNVCILSVHSWRRYMFFLTLFPINVLV